MTTEEFWTKMQGLRFDTVFGYTGVRNDAGEPLEKEEIAELLAKSYEMIQQLRRDNAYWKNEALRIAGAAK